MTTRSRARKAEQERDDAERRARAAERQLEKEREENRQRSEERLKVMRAADEELHRLRRTVAQLVYQAGGKLRLTRVSYEELPAETLVEAVQNEEGGLTLRLLPPK